MISDVPRVPASHQSRLSEASIIFWFVQRPASGVAVAEGVMVMTCTLLSTSASYYYVYKNHVI